MIDGLNFNRRHDDPQLASSAPPDQKDAINPQHYQRNGIECIDAIAGAVQNLAGMEAHCTGTAIKYLWRWQEKGGIEDLKKARWYIDRLISEVKP